MISPDRKVCAMKKNRTLATLLSLCILFCLLSTTGIAAGPATIDNADIVGAGATFPAPLYQRWIKEFGKQVSDFTLFYDAVGSGDGIKRFMSEKVAFGASDAAMDDEQISKVERGVQLIPATAGIIVLAYNLPDLGGRLRLSRKVYTDIFFGKIKKWNDPRIAELNPNLKLPEIHIATVCRSDSSGTTWAFSNHLSAVSDSWRDQGPGRGKKIDWPGNSMSGRYNEGVAMKIKLSRGSIGYVEYGIAKRAFLDMAALENKEGRFVEPTDSSGTVTLANTSTRMPSNLRMFLPDPDGEDSYPIVTYTWLLLYSSYPDKIEADRVKKFVRWGLTDGQSFAKDYGYAPLPEPVASSALKALDNIR